MSKLKQSRSQEIKDSFQDYKELKGLSAYVELYSRSGTGGKTRSVYKIIIEDNSTNQKFLGYSLDKSRMSLEIFMSYVLANLESTRKNRNVMMISAGGEKNVEKTSDIAEGDFPSKKKTVTRKSEHRKILKELYREMLLGNGRAETTGTFDSDSPLIPPVFVDSFISDIERIRNFTDFWKDYHISKEDKEILLSTLDETVLTADRYSEDFEFEKAVSLYNRLQKAAFGIGGADRTGGSIILKKARIFFHLEQYDKCREISLDGIGLLKEPEFKNELGELHYYLGMISSYSGRLAEAERYFSRTLWLLNKSAEPGKKYIYYDALIRKKIISSDFKNALVKVNECIRLAFRRGDGRYLGYFYGVKAEIYIREARYTKALECLNSQLEYAGSSKDLIGESKCIAQIFSTSSYTGMISDSEAEEYLKRIKVLSKKTGKDSYYYNSLVSYAVFLYRSGSKDKAEKYFRRSAAVFKEENGRIEEYIVNMIYLAKILSAKKKYTGSLRLLNRLLDLCGKHNIKTYPAYIENAAATVYHETHRYPLSLTRLNKCLKIIRSDRISDSVLAGHCHKLAGTCCIETGKISKALSHFENSVRHLTSVFTPEAENDILEIREMMKRLRK